MVFASAQVFACNIFRKSQKMTCQRLEEVFVQSLTRWRAHKHSMTFSHFNKVRHQNPKQTNRFLGRVYDVIEFLIGQSQFGGRKKTPHFLLDRLTLAPPVTLASLSISTSLQAMSASPCERAVWQIFWNMIWGQSRTNSSQRGSALEMKRIT